MKKQLTREEREDLERELDELQLFDNFLQVIMDMLGDDSSEFSMYASWDLKAGIRTFLDSTHKQIDKRYKEVVKEINGDDD